MLNVYSWNILSPHIEINLMTWGKNIKLSKMDKQRFPRRKKIILEIINHWLKNDFVVICLQEVCLEILQSLLTLPFHIGYTTDNNKSMLVTIIKGFHATTEHFTVLNKQFIKTTFNKTNIFNLHLYWKWNKKQLIKAGSTVYEQIDREKYLVCGDMNDNIDGLFPFLDEFDCIKTNDTMSGFTSLNVKSGKKDIIDHIFISPTIKPYGQIKIGTSILQYQIMYNVEKIVKKYKEGKLTLEWLNKRKFKDISDHNPIKLLIRI